MARSDEAPENAQQDPGGTLADAIAAHLALKKDHGADPNEVERERQSALAPARRDLDPSADLHPGASRESADAGPATSEPAPTEPAVSAADAGESPAPVPAPPERSPAPVEPIPVEPVPAETTEAQPQQDTGSFEFEWGGETDPPEPVPEPEPEAAEPAAADVLQQTPEFFEETPEYDRLWFEERPPRDFNF